MNRNRFSFAVCIDNKDYEASLELGKIYRSLPDDEAASHGCMRIIDESGEDYGYAAHHFFPMELPNELEKALVSALEMQQDSAMHLDGFH